MRRVSKVILVTIVLPAGALLVGCSPSSYFGRKFDDFTAHYNTFYNASRTFNEREKQFERIESKIDQAHYIRVFERPKAGGRSAEFEAVIEKSANILRTHPQSKWVDDALMLIGKSYFYQTNYVGAEQKFVEVINLDGELKDEARFWLGRTLVASRSAQVAEDVIRTALADEQLHKTWRPLLHLLLADLRTESEDWDGSIDAIGAGLPDTKDNDIVGRARFLLGQLYETVGDFEASRDAYASVSKHKPLYELAFAAETSEIRVEGLHIDPDGALRHLSRMIRDNKHFQYLDRLEYLEARILAAGGSPHLALNRFNEILYRPPNEPRTTIRGKVHFRMGELFRDNIGDFYLAAVHFDTASSVLRSNVNQNETLTPEAIVSARSVAAVFSTYRDVIERVQEMDSLLHLGTLDDAAFDSAVTQVRIRLGEEAARAREELERRQTQTRFQGTGRRSGAEGGIATPVAPGRSSASGVSRFGFLNHLDIQRVQEGFLNFQRIWGDRPLVPGWRREEEILSSRSLQQDELDKDGIERVNTVPSVGTRLFLLPPVDISNVPRDSLSRESMRGERAAVRYQVGNVLFLALSLPDSAAFWYRLVIDEDSDQPVARRAIYAMAEVHAALGDEEASNRLFAAIIEDDPESSFADRARVQLDMEPRTEAATDEERALAEYDIAFDRWVGSDMQGALDRMVRLAADYPTEEIAAKALLATAVIFTDRAHAEGLDLFGEIIVSDTLFLEEEITRSRPEIAADTVEAELPETSSIDTLQRAVIPIDTLSINTVKVDTAQAGALISPDLDVGRDESRPTVLELQEGVSDNAPSDTDILPLSDRAPALESTADDDALIARRNRDQERNPAREDELLLRQNDDQVVFEDDEVLLADRLADAPDQVVRVEPTSVIDRVAAVPEPTTTAPVAPVVVAVDPTKPVWEEIEFHINNIIPEPLTLYNVFRTVEDQFGGTEYGERASGLKKGLIAHRTAILVREDSLRKAAEAASLPEVEISDSTAALQINAVDDIVLQDSVLEAIGAPDSASAATMTISPDSLAGSRQIPAVPDSLLDVRAPSDSLLKQVWQEPRVQPHDQN